MALFSKTKAAISPPPSKAAAAGGGFETGTGRAMIGAYYNYFEGDARNAAMSVPTVSRARDLIASVIGCMPLKQFSEMWNGDTMEKVPMAPRTWLRRIDPSVPNNFILSWTFDDLFFYGRAFWYCLQRTSDGFPTAFTRLPASMVLTLDQAGPVWFAPSKEIQFNGNTLDPNDVIQFLSPIQGITSMSTQAVATALKLEAARYRNASSAIPAGVLQVQAGSEPLSSTELADLAASFNSARATNQTAALSPEVHYLETQTSPDRMLLIDSAEFQGKEMARICNVPLYLVGFSQGSMAYVSNQGARADLWTFGARPYADCITSTLSQNNVLPNGTMVEFDTMNYLMGDYHEMPQVENNERVESPT
jgi:phage portal protein BeeE